MKYDFDLENRKEARKHLVKMILLTIVEVLILFLPHMPLRIMGWRHLLFLGSI